MLMATIEITSWRQESTDYTGWGEHANTELKKRLRKSINISPREVKELVK